MNEALEIFGGIEALLEAATANPVAVCEDCGWERHLVPTSDRCVDCHIESEEAHHEMMNSY